MDKDIIVRALNGLIVEALMHGGDPGGPYYCNEELLVKSMEHTKALFGLDNYIIREVKDVSWEYEPGKKTRVTCHQYIKV